MSPRPRPPRPADRVARGDWQTPPALARRVAALLRGRGVAPAAVVEPTCGRGAFVAAALEAFPAARVVGYELSAEHLAEARSALASTRAELHPGDFFAVDWAAVLAGLPDPVLVLGNPPWVTSAALGALAAGNLPAKSNFQGHRGLDAITGRANFDISEWMLRRLLDALRGRDFTLAMLCKSAVARRVLQAAAAAGLATRGALWGIDAGAHFDAAVDASLLVVSRAAGAGEHRWPVFDGLDAARPSRALGVLAGEVVFDLEAAADTAGLAGPSTRAWRSGLKHDCAAVMELRRHDGVLRNGLGEPVALEPEVIFPLRKGSDVANGRGGERFVVVTQRAIGEDTLALRARAPRAWAYLESHRARFEARRSAIYRGQGPFAMFGLGPYSFAPYKVAICGLYKRLRFTLVGPEDGRPVMLDDTVYFLPCATEGEAAALAAALNGPRARRFFEARIFWDAKRPIQKSLLAALSLDALLRGEG
jgi:hypothetical protein